MEFDSIVIPFSLPKNLVILAKRKLAFPYLFKSSSKQYLDWISQGLNTEKEEEGLLRVIVALGTLAYKDNDIIQELESYRATIESTKTSLDKVQVAIGEVLSILDRKSKVFSYFTNYGSSHSNDGSKSSFFTSTHESRSKISKFWYVIYDSQSWNGGYKSHGEASPKSWNSNCRSESSTHVQGKY